MNGIFQALGARKHLSAQQLEVLNTRQLAGSLSPQEWIDVLGHLGEYDQACEGAKKQAMILMIFSGLIAILSLFLAAHVSLVWLISAAIFAVLTLIFLIFYRMFKKGDLPNGLREVVAPLMGILREDMKPNAPVELALDLRGATDKSKRKKSVMVPKEDLPPRVYSRKNTLFEDPWLTMKGKLVDQTGFHLVCRCDTTGVSIKKRGSSGKTKYKTKWKYKLRKSLTLKPDPSVYLPVEGREFPPVQTTLKPTDGGFAIQSRMQSRFAGHPKTKDPEVDHVMGLFVAAMAHYQPNQK